MTVSVYEVKKLRKIREQLVEIAEQEATKLFRLARRAETHGCSNETVEAIREEARDLYTTGYTERLLDPCKIWKFAFRQEGL